MITEFGAEANRHGPVSEKGTYEFQSEFLDYHLRVFARKPFINGAIVWSLHDFRVKPGWAGGNPLPHPPVNEKGLIDDAGFASRPSRPCARFSVVPGLFAGAPTGPTSAWPSGRAARRHRATPCLPPSGGSRQLRPVSMIAASRSSCRRRLSTLADIASHRDCSSRKPSPPSRSSQSTRRVQRLPSRSRSAMIGLPVREPRTGLPGIGDVGLRFEIEAVAYPLLFPKHNRRPP